MKHLKHFDDFFRDTVNLDRTQVDSLQKRVHAIEKFIRKSDYEPVVVRFRSQGSWAHKTIINPPYSQNFDADVLMIVRKVTGWNPSDYIENLYTTFKGSYRYKGFVSQKTRCIRINYKNDFHIDLVPIIKLIRHGKSLYFNCNSFDNKFEKTAPEAYTDWWINKNKDIGGNRLRLVTRLLKYIRDVKGAFSCKSILLTTLVGNQVYNSDSLYSDQNFPDPPTSLRTIVSRLDDWLQQHPGVPLIKNPVLASENYNRHWNQKKYKNFQKCIHRYRKWIDDAYAELDKNESILKWRRVFGDDFAKSEDVKSSTPQLVELFQFSEKWFAKVQSLGPQVLLKFPKNFSHVKPAWWTADKQLQAVVIDAGLARKKGGKIEYKVYSGKIIPAGFWIKFQAFMSSGIPSSFHVEWRVVNTGVEAFQAKQRRGDFYDSNQHTVRWESTQYRGIHWVEAFVINSRTRKLVGKSERFFVLIE